MTKSLIINDLHLGVNRVAGTTLNSVAELRDWLFEKYEQLLQLGADNQCSRIIINGDLTDAYDIPLAQALQLYEITLAFILEHPHIEIVWVLGNHDLAKDSSKMGTVAFVGALLKSAFPSYFHMVAQPECFYDVYVIPHVTNQDIFDLELSRVPDGVKWLLLHCNMDNKFASDAEHSLNLSRDQAKALKERGITMVLGHEHQGRELMKGSVVIVGNQFPSSISDCLSHGDGQKDGTKRAMIIEGDGHEFVTTWTPDDADGWFARVDWRELAEVEEDGRGFIRVEGDATADEAPEVIKAISSFRQRSKSFVVANAVKVESLVGLGDLAESIEDIRSIDVMELLLAELTDEQATVIRKLIGEQE